jgi:hypothetical protein
MCGIPARETPEGRLTLEHAYPAWIANALAPKGDVEWQLDRHPIAGRRLFEVEIAALCRACNGSWGRDYEQRVARWVGPSLRDLRRDVILNSGQQRLLATWAVKTGLLVELALEDLRGPALTPRSHLEWLHTHHRPPVGSTVWMFAVNIAERVGNENTVRALLAWGKTIGLGAQPFHPPRGYMTTFTAGYIGFQVMGWELDARVPLGPSHVLLPNHMKMAIRQLWPAMGRRSFIWPWTVEGRRAAADDARACVSADWEDMETLATWPLHRPGLVSASATRIPSSE